MKRKLLVVGGTKYQIPIIKKAREMGLYVINVDGNKNSPAFSYADECLVIDIMNYKEVLTAAKKLKIDGIVTDQSDISLRAVSFVGNHLGLPSISPDKLRLFTNKYCMRNFLMEHGFCCPKYRLCHTIEDAYQFFDEIQSPFVLKPLDSRGSKGVICVHNRIEIENEFLKTMGENIEAEQILAEEYIDGTYYVMDGIKLGCHHETLAIGVKTQYTQNDMVTQSIFYENGKYPELEKWNNTLIEMTGIDFATTHVECKCKDGRMVLIEFAARGGGANISHYAVPWISGVDTEMILIQHAMGFDLNPLLPDKLKKSALLMYFLNVQEGIVEDIIGSEEIRRIPEVADFELEISKGDRIFSLKDAGDRIGGYIICGTTQEHVESIKKVIDSKLIIQYKNQKKGE